MSGRTIEVLEPGFLSTVQDLGRFGYGELGVSACGAADPLALRAGNRLVGNRDGAPAIEMTLRGGRFRFPSGAVIALAGAPADAAPWVVREVSPGGTLELGPVTRGARAYLCVRGGIAVPRVLGSASTHLLTGLGGVEGRALRAGDALPVGREPASPPRSIDPAAAVRALDSTRLADWYRRDVLRVTPGPQHDWFTAEAHRVLADAAWRVTEGSDRMGLRLDGAPLARRREGELLTEGVALGAVQVTPDGLPLVLFVDHQTTGGYPKIASVAAVDLHLLGQLRPRDTVRFAPIGFDEARARLLEREEELDGLVGHPERLDEHDG